MWIKGRETKNVPLKNIKSWNRKLIRKLLLIMIVADLEQFTDKSKLITYIRAFVKLYN